MKMLTLSGWGQPADALRPIAPKAAHFDYSAQPSVDHIFEALEREARDVELIIGWSMGGQLAARAISAGLIAPQKLVLLATPFRFVEGADKNGLGMKADTFAQFRDNLAKNQPRTLKKAWALVAHGDERAEDVAQLMAALNPSHEQADWLKWLDSLSNYSCEGLEFKGFPPTLLVHGDRDAVVSPAQSREFAERIPQVALEIWQGCGHAPHLHDAPRLMERIKTHAR